MPPCWIHVSPVETEVSLVCVIGREKLSFPPKTAVREKFVTANSVCGLKIWFLDLAPQQCEFGFVLTSSHENGNLLLLQHELLQKVVLVCNGSARKTDKSYREVTKVTSCYFNPCQTWFMRRDLWDLLKAILVVAETCLDHVFLLWFHCVPVIFKVYINSSL